jgi:hypothetical protein
MDLQRTCSDIGFQKPLFTSLEWCNLELNEQQRYVLGEMVSGI